MSESFFRRWITTFMADFNAHSDELGDMDRIAGDGDFAVNIQSALKRVRQELEDVAADAPDSAVADAVSRAFLNTGGTSGPLLGMWFRDIGKAFAATDDELAALARGVDAGTQTVQRLGGAERGDKTMVDAMAPAAEALRGANESGSSLGDGLRAAADAAQGGADATTELEAQRGRASYVGDVAVGVTDPGAAAVALFFRSGLSSLDA